MERPQIEPTQTRLYPVGEEPDVEVLYEGRWCYGILRAWFQYEDGSWWANVRFHTGVAENRVDTVPAARVRPDPAETSAR